MSNIVVGFPMVTIGKHVDGTMTAEQYANAAVHKILTVSNRSHPIIREQANAFKEKMYDVLADLFNKAMEDERRRMGGK